MKLPSVNSHLHFFVLGVLCLLPIGCGFGNNPSALNGNWVTSLNLPAASNLFPVAATFAMSGDHYNSATGIARIVGLPCLSADTPVSVEAIEDTISLQTKWNAPIAKSSTLALDGVQSVDFSTMRGTFSISGADCGGLSSGNFSAKKYMPLSGSFLGSFVTSKGDSLVLLTSLEQSSTTDASGRYPLLGSASVTPMQCINNPALVNSYVIGDTFSAKYVGTDQTQLNVSGTFSADARTVKVESFAIVGGPCDGSSAMGSLTTSDQ